MPDWESALGATALKAHLEWVERSGQGPGRLHLVGQDLRNSRIGADLSGSRLEKCDLRNSHFHLAILQRIEWVDCLLQAVRLDGCDLEESVLRNCQAQGLSAPASDFVGARLSHCQLTGAVLPRTGWNHAHLEQCDFSGSDLQDSTLDGAHFQDCDFRGASLRCTGTTPLGTAEGTLFRNCDFRAADLTDLAAATARFEDCRFHGSRVETVFASGAVILRPDLSI